MRPRARLPVRLPAGLAARLFVAQLLVIVAGAGTLLLVALAVGPGIFHQHVRDALGFVPLDVSRHLDDAFDQATLIALGIAVAVALATAIAVSWIVTRRVVRPIRELALAADRIAAGATGTRIAPGGADELATVASAFNGMAEALEATESRRRRLLADIAHELRTPLATVEGYVEGLADGVLQADDESWRALRGETRRLGRLVDDLRKVSLAEEGRLDLQLRPAAPSAIVAAAIRSARPSYAAGEVTLTHRAGSGLPEVRVDGDRIAEVLANLLDNALRHTPSGGAVEVVAQQSGDGIEFSVGDTGAGVAPEHIGQIFDRFYRADPARARATGGSGIGLSIARAIVEAHGGTIRAESDGLGRGLRVAFTLPRHALRDDRRIAR